MLKRRRKLNLFDLKLFKEFLTSEDERRELQEIPAAKLQQFDLFSTCFHDSKIKFISSHRRVISPIRNLTKLRNYLYT